MSIKREITTQSLNILCFPLLECPQLPSTLQHGTVIGSGHVEGSLHRFTCNDGYSIAGQDVLYCNEMGHWNASVPTCLIGTEQQ